MLSLPDHLTHIVEWLRTVIRMVAPPATTQDPRSRMFGLLSNRVARAAERFARLFALWQSGRLRAPRPSGSRPRPAEIAPGVIPPPPPIPRRRGWLLRLGQHHAGLAAARLAAFLERPDLPEFLAAVPRAGRHLRPLCRMLAVKPPAFLALPPRPRKPRPPRKPRISLRNPVLPPGDPPFRPYVLAAARYYRKKFGSRF